MTPVEIQPASLASTGPYPVPTGGHLAFAYERWTTDGWSRGIVSVVWDDGRPPSVVARQVPVVGDATTVRALGDYAHLFPEPIPVVG
jgi:hypothetical protein